MARRKAVQPEELFGDFQHMLDALNNPEPLPCALIGAAFVEGALIALLRKFLIAGSDTAEKIFNEGKPLGAFNACAEMAYCLGLISKPTLQNCLAVAEVRNAFAHRHDAPTFDDQAIKQLCSQFKRTDFGSVPIPFNDQISKTLSGWKELSPRDHFVFTSISLFQMIMFAASGTTRRERYEDK